jgi:hypothetical protein
MRLRGVLENDCRALRGWSFVAGRAFVHGVRPEHYNDGATRMWRSSRLGSEGRRWHDLPSW